VNTTDQTQVPPVAASIDNLDDWEPLAHQLNSETGLPTVVTPDLLVGMVGSAVALLFAADAAGNANLLRGTFTDSVIAQCARNAGSLLDAHPTAARIHLVGAHVVDGHPVLRAHVAIEVQNTDGSQGAESQFWDLQLGTSVTVGESSCPRCGAPVGTGELICRHCQADVRSVVTVPLVVSRLALY
jgi:hypothetical protein